MSLAQDGVHQAVQGRNEPAAERRAPDVDGALNRGAQATRSSEPSNRSFDTFHVGDRSAIVISYTPGSTCTAVAFSSGCHLA
jgi:hypothetical protein